ncbi:MAG: NAD(P)-dependent oxidoreductase [Hyphomicrobiales bacterium]|nr:NAD(P)-dependent oxidoreductase [Hyphomicrobiales bacterium]
MSDFSIGVIGLDLLGGAISERLEDQEFGHVVTDINAQNLQIHVAESGVAPAATPTDVGHMCDLIFVAETSDTTFRESIIGPTGLIHGVSPGAIVVDMSETDPRTGIDMAGRLGSKGVVWLEAAIVGNADDIREGRATLLTSGREDALETIAPVLSALSARSLRLGHLGSGKLAKALGTSANAMAVAIYTEVMLIAKRAGLDAAGVLAALPYLAPGAGAPPDAIASEVLTGRYDSGTPVDQVQQDLQVVAEAALRAGAPSPMLSLVQSAFAAARFIPDANGDASDMPRWLAHNAGVEFVLDDGGEGRENGGDNEE